MDKNLQKTESIATTTAAKHSVIQLAGSREDRVYADLNSIFKGREAVTNRPSARTKAL